MASAILFYIVIIPNAFATELIKMIAAKNGQRYLIIKQKIFLRRNGCPSFVISFSNLSTPTTLDTRRHVAIAAIGIITEFVMKSKKFKIHKWTISKTGKSSKKNHDHTHKNSRFSTAPVQFIFEC